MTRRDLFKQMTGALAAAGAAAPIALDATEAPSDPTRALVVLRFDGPLSVQAHEHIRESWAKAVAGTPWAEVRLMVLDGRASFKVYQIDAAHVHDSDAAVVERLRRNVGGIRTELRAALGGGE